METIIRSIKALGRLRIAALRILISVMFAAGCASLGTVEQADLAKGHHREFDAPFEVVAKAAVVAVQRIPGVTVEQVKEQDSGTMILASKAMNLNSWGEYLRVYVERGAQPPTTVRVVSSKRSRAQLTGTWQFEFANAVFAGVGHELAR